MSNYDSPRLDVREVGRVLEVGDGIAQIYGLSARVMAGEMVEFRKRHVNGLAFNLEENSVGVIILGDYLTDRTRAKKFVAPAKLLSPCLLVMNCSAG